jgi:hypothetical protein
MGALRWVSAAQLLMHLMQARRGIRDGISYDLGLVHGEPENVSRDMWTMGSGTAAPWTMLGTHLAATVLAFVRPRPWVRRLLGVLACMYVVGYLGERSFRESYRHPAPGTTVPNTASFGLAVAMALVAFHPARR